MTRFSLSKVLGLVLGCGALVLGPISASADDFFAQAGTTFILVPVPDTSPQQFTHTVDGVVQVASLGDCTVHFDLVVTATDSSTRPYLVTGTQIITSGDGKSTLTSRVNGYLASNPANATFLARLSQLEGVEIRKSLQIKTAFQKVCTKVIRARVGLSA